MKATAMWKLTDGLSFCTMCQCLCCVVSVSRAVPFLCEQACRESKAKSVIEAFDFVIVVAMAVTIIVLLVDIEEKHSSCCDHSLDSYIRPQSWVPR